MSTAGSLEVGKAAARGTVVVWLLIAGIVTDALNVVVTAAEHATLQRFQRGAATFGEVNRAIERSGAVGILIFVVFLATGIAWLVWQHRSQANLHAARVPRLSFTPGWAVGWWFVPIASLWKPYQAVRELHQAAAGDPAWRAAPAPPVLRWWWAGYLAFNVLDGIAAALFSEDSGSVEPLLAGDRFSIAGDLVSIATAFLAIRIVRTVVERQRGLSAADGDGSAVPPRPDLRPLPGGGLP